jgi:hypothetical protein
MKRSAFLLVALVAGAAGAQQAEQQPPPPTRLFGHQLLRPTPGPPTLPLRHVIGQRPLQPQKPAQQPNRVIYVPAAYPYYVPPAQSNVQVNVTNVIEPPPTTVNVFAPGWGGQTVPAGLRPWDPARELAEMRAAEAAAYDDSVAAAVEADSADVHSPEAIVGALYDVLSGPRGTPRNWERFRTLFADGAHMTATTTERSGRTRPEIMSIEEYASIATPVLERGVYQREVTRTVQRFGSIAHVFSTYECRRMTSDEKPYQRGINSIQLLNDGTRWWITSVSWDVEKPGQMIPARGR